MSKFLLITSNYFPNANANTLCVEQIRKELVKKGHQVDLYVMRNYYYEKEKELDNGKVFYFNNVFNKEYFRLADKGIEYIKLPKIKKLFIKIKQRLNYIRYYYLCDKSTDSIVLSKVENVFLKENQKQQYDYMVCFSHPFGMTKLAKKIKQIRPSIVWTQYMLDPFVYNYTSPKNKIKKRQKQFIKYAGQADKIIYTRGIAEENARRDFVHGLEDRQVIVELPNLVKKETPKPKNNYTDKVELVFSGNFYKDIRNPKPMLEFFTKLNMDNFVLTLMSDNCDNIINEYRDILKDKLNIKGFLPYNEYADYVVGSNIMVNLGNSIPNQVPSKVFEYIASGKPVINFYTTENDTSLYYFKRYPLAFNINLNYYDNNTLIELKEFIIKNSNKKISFEEATINMQECISNNVINKVVDYIMEYKNVQ